MSFSHINLPVEAIDDDEEKKKNIQAISRTARNWKMKSLSVRS